MTAEATELREAPECSRAGCRASASWNVNWRNPKIHAEDRVKVWLACDDHREFLHNYLDSRGFPVSVEKRVPASTQQSEEGR